MPHDLFGDVVHASITVGGRTWHTLPLSVATHSLAISAVVVVSLISIGALPIVPKSLPPYMAASLHKGDVPLAPTPARHRVSGQASANPDLAPLASPVGVAPDQRIIREPEGPDAVTVPGGLAAGIPGGGAIVPPDPPSPPAQIAPIRVFGGIRPPTRIRDVRPIYPELARHAKVAGTVIIEAVIGPDGRVTVARILRSIPLLDRAALDAVSQWLYTPTLLSGTPVSVVMTVTVTFALQ